MLLFLLLASSVYCFWNGIKRRKFGFKNSSHGLMYKDNIQDSLRHRLQERINIYLIIYYFRT